MASSTNITITIVDEGYFKKVFSLSPRTKLKKLLNAYRAHICDTCSNPSLLDFWYETAKITESHTAEDLGIQTGDIIDVRISTQVTRGSCPIAPEQTLPNIHYLASPPPPTTTGGSVVGSTISEPFEQPEPPKRITLKIRDQNGFELTLAVKTSTPFRKIKEAFAVQAEKDILACRLLLDGKRVGDGHSPETEGMEDGDLLEVFFEQTGGSIFEFLISRQSDDWEQGR